MNELAISKDSGIAVFLLSTFISSGGLGDEIERWDLVPMPMLLMQMLLQTIECLGSDQWELRRMGHQVCE